MDSDARLREQLLQLLSGRNAHLTFEMAVKDFPMNQINTRPPSVPYSPWQLLEHIRIAQWDILEFTRDPDHVSPEWPTGYWPPENAEADAVAWQATLAALRADMRALEELVRNPDVNLYADLPHAEGYTVLREIMLVADHSAYHIGEFAILRQVMGTWPS